MLPQLMLRIVSRGPRNQLQLLILDVCSEILLHPEIGQDNLRFSKIYINEQNSLRSIAESSIEQKGNSISANTSFKRYVMKCHVKEREEQSLPSVSHTLLFPFFPGEWKESDMSD
jgi:hypothetical protein